MIPLTDYAKIKDNYCIAYFGHTREYLVQLRLLRPFIESTYKGLRIYLCSRDEYTYLFNDEPRILSKSMLQESKNQFAYIREISCNGLTHPVEELMFESEIPCGPICKSTKSYGNAVLLTKANPPAKSLSFLQTQKAIDFIKSKVNVVDIDQKIDNYDWVIGVENENLYEAAANGKKVSLISTGIGKNLFKMMFPEAEILDF